MKALCTSEDSFSIACPVRAQLTLVNPCSSATDLIQASSLGFLFPSYNVLLNFLCLGNLFLTSQKGSETEKEKVVCLVSGQRVTS